MGVGASLKRPKKAVSQEMIDTGLRIGRVAVALQALRANVAAKTSGSGNRTSDKVFAPATSNVEQHDEEPHMSSVWAKFKKSKSGHECVDPEQMRSAREAEANQLRKDDPHFDQTKAMIDYDVVQEEDMDKRQCGYCNIINRDTVYECRVCADTFHRGCLVKRGIGQDMNSNLALKDAERVGWSCPDCDDLSDLLPMDVVSDLMDKFDTYDTSGLSFMTLTDYLISETINNPNVSDRELQRKFIEYDRDNDGKVTWHDYIMTETVNYLKKQPQHALLTLLKPMEVQRLRMLFREQDQDNTGVITVPNAERAYRTWLSGLDIPVADEFRKSEERSSGPNHSRLITWERFIRNKALSIITARPNTRTFRPYLASMHTTAF